MKDIVSRLLLAALLSAPFSMTTAACDTDDKPVVDQTTTQDALQQPDTPVIPAYSPLGDDAALKRLGAAGIDDKNAAAKASELEGALDAQIKTFEANKTAKAG